MDRLFSNNNNLKVLAAIIALILWMYVMTEQNPQVTHVFRDVPVSYQNLDNNKLALRDTNQESTVDVTVRARRNIIANIDKSDIKCLLNLKGRMEGENLIPVAVKLPEDVELVDVKPREIVVYLDAVIEEQFPVKVQLQGVPARGYAALDPAVKQKEVIVKGARSKVNSIKTVVVQIDISGESRDVVGSYPVRVFNSNGKVIEELTFRPEVIEVVVPIVFKRDLPVKLDLAGAPAPGYLISNIIIEPQTITVTGNKDLLEKINFIKTAPIDVTGIKKSLTGEISVIMPKGVKLLDKENNNINVEVHVEKEAQKTITTYKNIEVENLTGDLIVEVDNVETTLVIKGPQNLLNQLTADDFKLFVDAEGLTVGEYELPLQAALKEGLTLSNITPQKVKVKIKR